jgi:hypothetical protein
LAGAIGLYSSISYGREQAKMGNIFKNELQIRQTLDKIIQNAVDNFDQQEFRKFFVALSEPFDKNDNVSVALITCDFEKEKMFKVDPIEIIYNMHVHGFKPEAIAYLINMIFESLLAILYDQNLKKDFSKMGISDSTIKSTIEGLLDSITNKPNALNVSDQKKLIYLEEEAQKLDDKLREIQSRILIDNESYFGRAKNMWYKFKTYVTSQGIIDEQMINVGKEVKTVLS